MFLLRYVCNAWQNILFSFLFGVDSVSLVNIIRAVWCQCKVPIGQLYNLSTSKCAYKPCSEQLMPRSTMLNVHVLNCTVAFSFLVHLYCIYAVVILMILVLLFW